jgi:hypothetical protein
MSKAKKSKSIVEAMVSAVIDLKKDGVLEIDTVVLRDKMQTMHQWMAEMAPSSVDGTINSYLFPFNLESVPEIFRSVNGEKVFKFLKENVKKAEAVKKVPAFDLTDILGDITEMQG